MDILLTIQIYFKFIIPLPTLRNEMASPPPQLKHHSTTRPSLMLSLQMWFSNHVNHSAFNLVLEVVMQTVQGTYGMRV